MKNKSNRSTLRILLLTLWGIGLMVICADQARCCGPSPGPCYYWDVDSDSWEVISGSTCTEDSQCGTCGNCSGNPCACSAKESLCDKECDECDTSGPDIYNCYDDDDLCTAECDVCTDGECVDDDDLCTAECDVCSGGECVDDDLQCSGCLECDNGTCEPHNENCHHCKYCANNGNCYLDVIFHDYECAGDAGDCTTPQTCVEADCECVGGCNANTGDLCTYTIAPGYINPNNDCGHPVNSYRCNQTGSVCAIRETDAPTRDDACDPGLLCDLTTTYCAMIVDQYGYNKYTYIAPGWAWVCTWDTTHESGFAYPVGSRVLCLD